MFLRFLLLCLNVFTIFLKVFPMCLKMFPMFLKVFIMLLKVMKALNNKKGIKSKPFTGWCIWPL